MSTLGNTQKLSLSGKLKSNNYDKFVLKVDRQQVLVTMTIAQNLQSNCIQYIALWWNGNAVAIFCRIYSYIVLLKTHFTKYPTTYTCLDTRLCIFQFI